MNYEKTRTSSIISTFALMSYPLYLLHSEVGLSIVVLLTKAGFLSSVAFGFTFVVVCVMSYLVVLLERVTKKFFTNYVFVTQKI